jgi:hypothetical protein
VNIRYAASYRYAEPFRHNLSSNIVFAHFLTVFRTFWLDKKFDKKISDPHREMRFAACYAAPQCASYGFCPNWLGPIASAQSPLDRISMSFFGMTPHAKNIFFKINPLT